MHSVSSLDLGYFSKSEYIFQYRKSELRYNDSFSTAFIAIPASHKLVCGPSPAVQPYQPGLDEG